MRRILIGGMVLMFCFLALVGLTVRQFFCLNGDTAALRQSALQSSPGTWHETVELNIGSWTTQLLQAGLSFVELPIEARWAINAWRHVQFGIYESHSAPQPFKTSTILEAVDQTMKERGRSRLIYVQHNDQGVAIYVADQNDDSECIHASVVIVEERQMILGSGRITLENLGLVINRFSSTRLPHAQGMTLTALDRNLVEQTQ